MLLPEYNPVEGYIPCKFWLDLAVNLQCMLKLNPHPIFARDKLAWVKYQVLLIVGKYMWCRSEFVL